jgi:hypothetical protein
MLTKNFLPHMKLHLKHAKYFQCISFEWCEAKGELVPRTSKMIKFNIRAQILIQIVYVIFQILMTIYSPYSLGKRLQAMVFTSIYLTGITVRWDWDCNLVAMRLLNSYLHFEKSFFKGKLLFLWANKI